MLQKGFMMRLTMEIEPSFTYFVFLSHPLLVYDFVLIPPGLDAIAQLLCEGNCLLPFADHMYVYPSIDRFMKIVGQ